jgi:anti-sigma regulatory factor (Ser/Thr protein kinase)
MAVNELLTNVVRHGGGTGRLTLWMRDGAVLCEVSDRGDGLDSGDVLDSGDRPGSGDGPGRVSRRRPAPDQPGGWGLWLVRELTDTCEIESGPDGTAVRISSRTDR